MIKIRRIVPIFGLLTLGLVGAGFSKYFKVAIGKGLLTQEKIEYYVNTWGGLIGL